MPTTGQGRKAGGNILRSILQIAEGISTMSGDEGGGGGGTSSTEQYKRSAEAFNYAFRSGATPISQAISDEGLWKSNKHIALAAKKMDIDVNNRSTFANVYTKTEVIRAAQKLYKEEFVNTEGVKGFLGAHEEYTGAVFADAGKFEISLQQERQTTGTSTSGAGNFIKVTASNSIGGKWTETIPMRTMADGTSQPYPDPGLDNVYSRGQAAALETISATPRGEGESLADTYTPETTEEITSKSVQYQTTQFNAKQFELNPSSKVNNPSQIATKANDWKSKLYVEIGERDSQEDKFNYEQSTAFANVLRSMFRPWEPSFEGEVRPVDARTTGFDSTNQQDALTLRNMQDVNNTVWRAASRRNEEKLAKELENHSGYGTTIGDLTPSIEKRFARNQLAINENRDSINGLLKNIQNTDEYKKAEKKHKTSSDLLDTEIKQQRLVAAKMANMKAGKLLLFTEAMALGTIVFQGSALQALTQGQLGDSFSNSGNLVEQATFKTGTIAAKDRFRGLGKLLDGMQTPGAREAAISSVKRGLEGSVAVAKKQFVTSVDKLNTFTEKAQKDGVVFDILGMYMHMDTALNSSGMTSQEKKDTPEFMNAEKLKNQMQEVLQKRWELKEAPFNSFITKYKEALLNTKGQAQDKMNSILKRLQETGADNPELQRTVTDPLIKELREASEKSIDDINNLLDRTE